MLPPGGEVELEAGPLVVVAVEAHADDVPGEGVAAARVPVHLRRVVVGADRDVDVPVVVEDLELGRLRRRRRPRSGSAACSRPTTRPASTPRRRGGRRSRAAFPRGGPSGRRGPGTCGRTGSRRRARPRAPPGREPPRGDEPGRASDATVRSEREGGEAGRGHITIRQASPEPAPINGASSPRLWNLRIPLSSAARGR